MKKKYRTEFLLILAVAAGLTACGGRTGSQKAAESGAQEIAAEDTEAAKGPEEKGGSGEEGEEGGNAGNAKTEGASVDVSKPRGLFEEFEAVDLDGNTVNQEIFADYDLTMINIWATFCGPCISEMPELGELAAEYKEKRVQIIGICTDAVEIDGNIIDGQIEEAKRIVEETGADYLHIVPNGALAPALLPQVQAVPTTIFVDRDGKQVGVGVMGARDKASWEKMIEELPP